MKRYILTLTILALLTGCSSSDNSPSSSNPNKPTIPDIDNSPEWGLDTGDTPDWGLVDPEFGVPDTGESPDRLPPVWGGPELPPIDIGPEPVYSINGNIVTDAQGNSYTITDINWHGQEMVVEDEHGNQYEVSVIRQGKYEGDFGVIIDGEPVIIGRDTVTGGLRPFMETDGPSINRESIRDAIRSRLN